MPHTHTARQRESKTEQLHIAIDTFVSARDGAHVVACCKCPCWPCLSPVDLFCRWLCLWHWFYLWLFGMLLRHTNEIQSERCKTHATCCSKCQNLAEALRVASSGQCVCCVCGNCYTCSGSSSSATWQENYLSRHSFSDGIKFLLGVHSALLLFVSRCSSSSFSCSIATLRFSLQNKPENCQKKNKIFEMHKKKQACKCVNWMSLMLSLPLLGFPLSTKLELKAT